MTEADPEGSLPYSGEIWRKALHLLSISIPVGLLIFGRTIALYILVPLAAAFVIVEIARIRSQAVRDIVRRFFGFMMRAEEIPPAPAPIHFNGATWVLISACILVILFDPPVAAGGMVIGLIGDAAAALVGRRWGRRPLGQSGRTIEGMIAFILISFPPALLIPGLTTGSVLVAVIAAALVEGFGTPLNDNLSVPLAACIVLTLI
jgi:dolichol kinase